MTITCYGQTNHGDWCQEFYETAARTSAKRARQLRKAGYRVTVSALGPQVTRVGTVKMTMVDIRPGNNSDTFHLPEEDWKLERI
jgi:hypothetical protein